MKWSLCRVFDKHLHLLSYPHETCFMSFQATTQNSPVYSKIACQYARLAVWALCRVETNGRGTGLYLFSRLRHALPSTKRGPHLFLLGVAWCTPLQAIEHGTRARPKHVAYTCICLASRVSALPRRCNWTCLIFSKKSESKSSGTDNWEKDVNRIIYYKVSFVELNSQNVNVSCDRIILQLILLVCTFVPELWFESFCSNLMASLR